MHSSLYIIEFMAVGSPLGIIYLLKETSLKIKVWTLNYIQVGEY